MRKTVIAALAMGGLLAAVQPASQANAKPPATITEDEVLAAKQTWADGIVRIGQAYQDKGDYRAAAVEHIRALYAYDHGGVLFKPTLASKDQFRENFDQALSYFVGGDIEEDSGFATRPWRQVRFGKRHIIINGPTAAVMGNYYFTPFDADEETKVEYTFGYIRDTSGNLRINIHHSSLPFTQ